MRMLGLTPTQRFWRMIDKRSADECWNWLGQLTKRGKYGKFTLANGRSGGRKITAHVFAYTEVYGSIPRGFDVHHTCRNKRCQNVRHMELLKHAEHAKLKSHAINHLQNGY
jgi:hypothetical protein